LNINIEYIYIIEGLLFQKKLLDKFKFDSGNNSGYK